MRKKIIFHVPRYVLSYEENYIRSAIREIRTFLCISPLHRHHVGRTWRSHFSRPVHPGMRKMVCMPCQSCCRACPICPVCHWATLSLGKLWITPRSMSTRRNCLEKHRWSLLNAVGLVDFMIQYQKLWPPWLYTGNTWKSWKCLTRKPSMQKPWACSLAHAILTQPR